MPLTTPDLTRALDLARAGKPWTADEQALVARALLAVPTALQRTRTQALDEAAQLLEGLADKEVMQPVMVGVYVRIAANIRALAASRKAG